MRWQLLSWHLQDFQKNRLLNEEKRQTVLAAKKWRTAVTNKAKGFGRYVADLKASDCQTDEFCCAVLSPACCLLLCCAVLRSGVLWYVCVMDTLCLDGGRHAHPIPQDSAWVECMGFNQLESSFLCAYVSVYSLLFLDGQK
jgi:hypothetical protein